MATRAGRVIVALAAAVSAAGPAAPAAATFTTNDVGCTGSATITAKNGKTYQVDAAASEAKVPKDGTAAWQGGLATATHNHRGSVKLAVALWDFTIGSWGPSENSRNETARMGTKEIPSYVAQLPPGKYVVSGSHRGDEGGCAGNLTVEIDGSFASNPAGIVSLAGTAVSAAAMAVAARARKP